MGRGKRFIPNTRNLIKKLLSEDKSYRFMQNVVHGTWTFVRRPKNKECVPKFVRKTVKHGGAKIVIQMFHVVLLLFSQSFICVCNGISNVRTPKESLKCAGPLERT